MPPGKGNRLILTSAGLSVALGREGALGAGSEAAIKNTIILSPRSGRAPLRSGRVQLWLTPGYILHLFWLGKKGRPYLESPVTWGKSV